MVNHKCLWRELKARAAIILLGVVFSLFSCVPAALAAGGVLSVFSGHSGTIADGGVDDLGNVVIATHEILYTLRNQGTGDLTIQTNMSDSSVNTRSYGYGWRDHNGDSVFAASFVIPAGQSGTLKISVRPDAAGPFSVSFGFDHDGDGADGTFNFTVKGNDSSTPEIAISGNGTDITDGDTTPSTADNTDFGSAIVGSTTVDKTYAITNSGTGALNVTGISIVGDPDFSIVYPTPATPIAANGGTSTLTIRFNPSAAGTRSATLSIQSDDPDENPFDFAIMGTATAPATPEISVSGNSHRYCRRGHDAEFGRRHRLRCRRCDDRHSQSHLHHHQFGHKCFDARSQRREPFRHKRG